MWLLDLTVVGSVWMLTVVAVFDAVLGTALGLFVSAFARTEFQAVQFMPPLVIPQILLCGLFVPRDALPRVLEVISDVLPLSYGVDAMQTVAASTATGDVWHDIGIVAAYAVAGLALGAAHAAPPVRLTRPGQATDSEDHRSTAGRSGTIGAAVP